MSECYVKQVSFKKDGYRQRNVRQFLQSAKAHYLATSRESRRYVVPTADLRAQAFGYVKRV